MDSSIASLFDDDDVEDVPRRQKTPHSDDEDARSPRPSKRRRQTVNLASDDEDAAGVMAPRDVDMRAMEELGDMDEDIQWEGADKMEQQIAARVKHNPLPPALTPHAILPSSSPPPEGAENSEKKGKGEKKPRRKPLVLKEGLLTGDNGFPKLISDMKQFKPKGKGHEVSPCYITSDALLTVITGLRSEPSTSSLSVLDTSTIPQSSFPGNRHAYRETMPYQNDAGERIDLSMLSQTSHDLLRAAYLDGKTKPRASSLH